MATKNYEINMDLGLMPLTINFTGGKEPVTIMFNPADVDMVRRLFEAQKIIEDKSKTVGDFEIDENGVPVAEDYIQKANELNKAIYDAIDYAFNASVSEQIFKYCMPFAIINGKPYVLQFLEKVAPFLKDTMEKENVKMEKYSKKYLGKYMK